MLLLFAAAIGLFLWTPAVVGRVITEGELAVMEGESLMIPCHYEPQHAGYVKYWCRGQMREFCSSLARTDEPRSDDGEEKVSIVDDPVQLVFTVTMRDLKEDDAGWYMCGVEIGGAWSADYVAYSYIKVIHGLVVVNSRLSGQEGSSVTVLCRYSERYRDSEKKWCRSGDWSSCFTAGSDGVYDGSSVSISDDRTRTFSVTLKELQLRDTGWYWCAAGQHLTPVHLLVSPRPSTTATPTTTPTTSSLTTTNYLHPPKPMSKAPWSSYSHILESLMICAMVVVVIGLVVLGNKFWRQRKQDAELRQVTAIKARHNECSGDVGDLQNASVVFLNRDAQEDVHLC